MHATVRLLLTALLALFPALLAPAPLARAESDAFEPRRPLASSPPPSPPRVGRGRYEHGGRDRSRRPYRGRREIWREQKRRQRDGREDRRRGYGYDVPRRYVPPSGSPGGGPNIPFPFLPIR